MWRILAVCHALLANPHRLAAVRRLVGRHGSRRVATTLRGKSSLDAETLDFLRSRPHPSYPLVAAEGSICHAVVGNKAIPQSPPLRRIPRELVSQPLPKGFSTPLPLEHHLLVADSRVK